MRHPDIASPRPAQVASRRKATLGRRDHGKHRVATDIVRRQRDERKERERWLKSRLPLDADQQAWVQEQVRKIEERHRAEREQHHALIDEANA